MDAVAVLAVGFGGWLMYAAYRNYPPISGIFTVLGGGSLVPGPLGSSSSASSSGFVPSSGSSYPEGTGSSATGGGGTITEPGNTAIVTGTPKEF